MTRTQALPLSRRIRSLAETVPDEPAYFERAGRVTWADYDERSQQLARLLIDRGLARGERVAILLPDGAAVHATLVGCEKAGCIAVAIGPRAGAREIAHLLRATGASALVSRERHQALDMSELVTTLRAEGLPLRHHFAVEGTLALGERLWVDGEGIALADLAAGPDPRSDERCFAADDLFLLNSTSGTTGLPKVVGHDQQRWFAFHRLAVSAGELSQDDVFMSVVPAPFGFGIWTSHVTPTLLAVPTVVMERFDPDQALALIEEHRVSVLAAVSTQFILLLESPASHSRDLTSLRVLFTGGEAVPYARAAAFEERTGAAVLQFYGSNETGAVSGTTLADSREQRLTTAGRPIPEMSLRLFDEAGCDVTETGRGQPGVKGPTLSRGYYGPGSDAANRELIRDDGWMMLGDVVELDAEGYLRVVGRTDDFIIRGGKNVSGPAVEQAVATHPAVALAAAVAMPDEVFGERVCVYVELRAGAQLTLDELVLHLSERQISVESWPERLVVVDQLPRGSGGKLAKQALREDIRRRLREEAE